MNPRSMLRFAAVFALVQAFGWFVAWLGGYNFDTRSPGVAYGALGITWLAVTTGVAVAMARDERGEA